MYNADLVRTDQYRSVSRRSVLKGLGTAATAGTVGLAGCLGGDDGGDGIHIGLQADSTGALSAYGYWHERVVDNYIEELNDNDGIDGQDIKLSVEDTETDSQQGIQAFRALVDREGVDFVIGTQDSGVAIATNSLAQELEVPYFPIGEAPSITGEDGNRWVLRHNHDTQLQANVAVDHGLDMGTDWTIIYQDYAFGQQYRDAIQNLFQGRDGTVLESIAVPVGETDLASYLNQVPDDTEVLFNALIGGSSVNFLRQSAELGVPGERLGAIASVEGLDVSELEAGEGAEYATMTPRELDEMGTDAYDHFYEIADVDGSDEVPVGGHWTAGYEALSWIRDAVEATGWSGEDDYQTFIEWFEDGPSVDGGTGYPQGPKYFRGEDHQCFMNMFVERIEDGELTVVNEVEFPEPPYEPRANLAGQEF